MARSTNRSLVASWLEPETLAKSVGLAVLLTIMARFAGFGRCVVFARWLTRAELGTWALSNNATGFLSFVLVLGIPGALSRYVERYRRAGQLRPFLVQTSAVCMGIGALSCVAGIVMCGPLGNLLFDDSSQRTLTVLTCLGMLAMLAFNVLQGVLQGLRVFRLNTLMQVAQSVLFAAVGALVLGVWRADAVGGAWAYLVSCFITTAVPAWMVWSYVRGEEPESPDGLPAGSWRQIMGYSLGTWAAGSVLELWRVIDRWMLMHADTLGATASLEQIGSYHIVDTLSTPFLAMGTLLSILLLPHLVHLWEARRDAEAQRLLLLATKLVMLGFVLASAGVVVLKGFLLESLFGDHTPESRQIMELVLVAMLAVAANFMIRSYLLCRERAWLASSVWLVVLALNIVMNLVLIPSMHLKGAAISLTVSGAAGTAVLIWLSYRDGLRLDAGTILATALPLVLLAPPLVMLGTLAGVSVLTGTTHVVLDAEEKAQINASLARLLGRRAVMPEGVPA